MEKRDWTHLRADVRPHDHAVFVYRDEEEILEPLESFLHEGVKRRELASFVHPFPRHEDARGFLARRLGDVEPYERNRDLSIAAHREAFERNGRIDHDHVAGIVGMLQESARAHGRETIRIFVDASKRYFEEGRVDEWFAFESWLGPRLQADAGLVCAYRARDIEDPAILARVLATHGYRFGTPARRQG